MEKNEGSMEGEEERGIRCGDEPESVALLGRNLHMRFIRFKRSSAQS